MRQILAETDYTAFAGVCNQTGKKQFSLAKYFLAC
jgi:hypothetical protein